MPATKSLPELTKEAWDILVQVAAEGEPITYGKLAEQLSHPGYRLIPQSTPQLLAPIMIYCESHSLPLLNDLVVGQRSRRPNYAPPGYDYEASQRRVFAFDWDTVHVDEGDFAGL